MGGTVCLQDRLLCTEASHSSACRGLRLQSYFHIALNEAGAHQAKSTLLGLFDLLHICVERGGGGWLLYFPCTPSFLLRYCVIGDEAGLSTGIYEQRNQFEPCDWRHFPPFLRFLSYVQFVGSWLLLETISCLNTLNWTCAQWDTAGCTSQLFVLGAQCYLLCSSPSWHLNVICWKKGYVCHTLQRLYKLLLSAPFCRMTASSHDLAAQLVLKRGWKWSLIWNHQVK